jgi:heme-degrading monooxygenase HmoA
MIARMWRGATARADAAVYARYVAETGIVAYRATAGNRGAQILQRDVGELTEIVTLSFWDSLEAIKGFAGDDIEGAVFYPEDDRYLVERDLRVTHFRVTDD